MMHPIDFKISRLIQAPPEAVFQVVADIPSYSEFLPGCLYSSFSPEQSIGTLTVGFSAWKGTISTHNTTIPYRSIHMQLHQAHPLIQSLEGQWNFEATDLNQTQVYLNILLRMKSIWMHPLARASIHQAAPVLLDAFEKRVHLI